MLIVKNEQILAKNLMRSILRVDFEANTFDIGAKALSSCHDLALEALWIIIDLPNRTGLDLLERLRLL